MLKFKAALVRRLGPLGGYRLVRFWTRQIPRILMYHRFSTEPKAGFVHQEALVRQLAHLKRNFNVLSLGELIGILKHEAVVPDDSVVITVDDGYRDFYDVAFPVLRDCGLPATLFVTTRFVDGGFWLWPDQVRYILKNSQEIVAPDAFGLQRDSNLKMNADGREIFWRQVVKTLLEIDDIEKNRLISIFAAQQSVEIPRDPVDVFSAVNWDQVREMSEAGIEIGAHSRTHPSLGRVSQDQLKYEIQGSVDDIIMQTGNEPGAFCYPNGLPADYNDLVKWHVKATGCNAAVTAYYDKYFTEDLFELRRFNVSSSWFQFSKAVNGIEALSARWLNSTNRNYHIA